VLQDNLKIFSFRWVDYCIERKFVFLDVKKHNYAHLLPFPKKVPLEDFKSLQVCVKGYDLNKEQVITEILKAMGAMVIDDAEDADYVVCSKEKEEKFRE
jgi:hypothetical protein